jgi:hypothetical protein
MSSLQHFARGYDLPETDQEFSQNDIDYEINSNTPTSTHEKFRLEYIYSTLLASPKCNGIQPYGFRDNVKLYDYQKVINKWCIPEMIS